MPLPLTERCRLRQATPLLIRDGDCRDLVSGLYGIVFSQNDRAKILNEPDSGSQMIKLIELYKEKASSLDPLRSVLNNYTLQPFLATELDKELSDSSVESPPICMAFGPNLRQFMEQLQRFYTLHFSSFKPISQINVRLSVSDTWINVRLESSAESTQHYQDCIVSSLATRQPVVIIGGPGEGKTMLVKRLALNWAVGKMPQYDLVLCARLREVPSADSVVDIGLNWLQRKLPHVSWPNVRVSLEQAKPRLLVVLDGLDESICQCTELDELLYSIDGIQINYDVIVTSRPRKSFEIMAPHESLRLLGFSDQQQLQCVEKHLAEAKQEAEKVKELLLSWPQFQEMARTPLLLSYLCLVHNHIKSDRLSELYEAVISCLINRYIRERCPKTTLFSPNWKECVVIRNLGKMALDGLLTVDSQDKLVFNEADLEAYEVNTELVKVGLLNVDGEFCPFKGQVRVYTFPHKTMQEFFGAWHSLELIQSVLENEWSKNLLANHYHFPNTLRRLVSFHNPWQLVEVFQFLLEFAERSNSESLVNRVLTVFFHCWRGSLGSYTNRLAVSVSVYVEDFWGKYDFRTFYSLKTKTTDPDIQMTLSELLDSLLECQSSNRTCALLASWENREDILRINENVYYFKQVHTVISSPKADAMLRKHSFSRDLGPDYSIGHVFCNLSNLSQAREVLANCSKVRYLRVHFAKDFLTQDPPSVEQELLPPEMGGLEFCLSHGIRRRWKKPSPDDCLFLCQAAQNLLTGVRKVGNLIIHGGGCTVVGLSDLLQATVVSGQLCLERLTLVRLKIPQDSLVTLCSVIASCRELEALEIAYCHLEKDDLLSICEACCSKGMQILILLGEACLRDCQTFKKFCKLLLKWPELRMLSLSSHILTDHTVQLLASDVLPFMANLECLQLNSNLISQKQIGMLKASNTDIEILL